MRERSAKPTGNGARAQAIYAAARPAARHPRRNAIPAKPLRAFAGEAAAMTARGTSHPARAGSR
ncbi:hypothetical protein WS91_27265 [Burkholderia sp. MSMB1498]|nr:hypothetical protein WS91_27265 [Burkholderia sp. MSMB1498]